MLAGEGAVEGCCGRVILRGEDHILRARDEGLPLPAAAVLLTAELDLTESGDSFHANMGVDTVLTQSLMPANLLYAAGHDLTDPYVSPSSVTSARAFPPRS